MATKPQSYRPRATTASVLYRPRERRAPSSQRGYDSAWGHIRDMAWGDRDKVLCDHCKAEGHIRQRQVLDHIIPHSGHGDPLLLDYANVRGLCYSHHTSKTKRHDKQIRADFDRLMASPGYRYDVARDAVIAKWRGRT